MTGAEAERRCEAARIILNKNAIPYDPEPPLVASGIRVGTPVVTTQGMTEADMVQVADLVVRAVTADPNTAAGEAALRQTAQQARELAAAHPAYPR